MDLRAALREQTPSLALQRAAADEIARLDDLRAKDREEIYRLTLKVDRLEVELSGNGHATE
jgi:hypothetical protein